MLALAFMRLLNVGVGVGPNVLLTSDGDTVLSGLLDHWAKEDSNASTWTPLTITVYSGPTSFRRHRERATNNLIILSLRYPGAWAGGGPNDQIPVYIHWHVNQDPTNDRTPVF